MPAMKPIDPLLGVLRDTITGMVRRNGPDLSARQFAVFLICYLEAGPHTVRGLAARLSVSRPVVTRLMDRMEELDLARRVPDPRDRRSVLIDRTAPGEELMGDIIALVEDATRVPVFEMQTPMRAGASMRD
jgi:DNA-binding MarR family transcriptional regulator